MHENPGALVAAIVAVGSVPPTTIHADDPLPRKLRGRRKVLSRRRPAGVRAGTNPAAKTAAGFAEHFRYAAAGGDALCGSTSPTARRHREAGPDRPGHAPRVKHPRRRREPRAGGAAGAGRLGRLERRQRPRAVARLA